MNNATTKTLQQILEGHGIEYPRHAVCSVIEWLQQKRHGETWCQHVRDYKKGLLDELEASV